MNFTSLGSPLNSTQMHFKPLQLVKGQRIYEAVKLPIHLQWASCCFEHTLQPIKLYGVVNLHGCSPV